MAEVTLTREQRDAIYNEVRDHLYACTDCRLERLLAPDLEAYLDLARQLHTGDPASWTLTAPARDLARVLSERIAVIDEVLKEDCEGLAKGPECEEDVGIWPEFERDTKALIDKELERRVRLSEVLDTALAEAS